VQLKSAPAGYGFVFGAYMTLLWSLTGVIHRLQIAYSQALFRGCCSVALFR